MKMSTIPTLLGPDGMTSLREYAGYHGGGSGFGGQLRAWNPPGESVDAALLPNFTRGNARADDLVRNNGYAANAIQLHQDHIVGSFFRLSHRPSWRYLGIGEEEARAFSREVEAAWKEFAEDDRLMTAVRRWDITSARTAILAGCRRNGHGYPVSYPAGAPRSFTFLNPWRTGRPAVQMCFTA